MLPLVQEKPHSAYVMRREPSQYQEKRCRLLIIQLAAISALKPEERRFILRYLGISIDEVIETFARAVRHTILKGNNTPDTARIRIALYRLYLIVGFDISEEDLQRSSLYCELPTERRRFFLPVG